jgi:hypothetical protein
MVNWFAKSVSKMMQLNIRESNSSNNNRRLLTNQESTLLVPSNSSSCHLAASRACRTPTWAVATTGNSQFLSIRISQRKKMISLRGKVTISNAWSARSTLCTSRMTSTVRTQNAQVMPSLFICKSRILVVSKHHREVEVRPRTNQCSARLPLGKKRSCRNNVQIVAGA